MGLSAWFKEMGGRKAKAEDRRLLQEALAARPPAGGVDICTLGAPEDMADRSGRIMLVLDGSFSENVGTDLLGLLARCRMDGVIGTILLIEGDRRRREHFLESAPIVFRDRVVAADLGLAGGFGNAAPAEVLSLIDRWGPSATRSANRVC